MLESTNELTRMQDEAEGTMYSIDDDAGARAAPSEAMPCDANCKMKPEARSTAQYGSPYLGGDATSRAGVKPADEVLAFDLRGLFH